MIDMNIRRTIISVRLNSCITLQYDNNITYETGFVQEILKKYENNS